MRRCALIVALALAPLGGCFVDAGPGATGSTGGGGTSSATTIEATTGSGTTSAGTTEPGTTGGATTIEATTGEATATTGAAETTTTTMPGSTGDASTGGPVEPPCAAYYGTEFSEAPGSDWKVLSQTWVWDEAMGLYRGSFGGSFGAATQLLVGSWKDVRVLTRLRVAANARGGVLVRLGDPLAEEYVYVEIDAATKTLAAYRGGMVQFSVGKYEVADTWVDLEVSFVGTTVGFSFNGKPLANGIQVDGLAAGAVGLLVRDGQVEFDSLYVCPPA